MKKSNSKNKISRRPIMLLLPVLACFLWAFASTEYRYVPDNTSDEKPVVLELPNNAIYFIDDEEVPKARIEKLDPEAIAMMDVYKEGFGLPMRDTAKQGVVLIYTKEFKEKQKEEHGNDSKGISMTKRLMFSRKTVKDKATGKVKESSTEYPVVIIDGKQVSPEYYFNEFDQDTERGYKILAPQVAERIYGEEAKNGILIIRTSPIKSDKDIQIEKPRVVIEKQQAVLPQDIIFIIDGVEVDKEKFAKMDAADIEKVDVLKDEPAVKAYGEKARSGVIVITTNKK